MQSLSVHHLTRLPHILYTQTTSVPWIRTLLPEYVQDGLSQDHVAVIVCTVAGLARPAYFGECCRTRAPRKNPVFSRLCRATACRRAWTTFRLSCGTCWACRCPSVRTPCTSGRSTRRRQSCICASPGSAHAVASGIVGTLACCSSSTA